LVRGLDPTHLAEIIKPIPVKAEVIAVEATDSVIAAPTGVQFHIEPPR
jgi:hypothetical protein